MTKTKTKVSKKKINHTEEKMNDVTVDNVTIRKFIEERDLIYERYIKFHVLLFNVYFFSYLALVLYQLFVINQGELGIGITNFITETNE